MNFFENQIAHLISLLMQLKAYAPEKVNKLLEVEKVESILDKPEISDRNWEKRVSRRSGFIPEFSEH